MTAQENDLVKALLGQHIAQLQGLLSTAGSTITPGLKADLALATSALAAIQHDLGQRAEPRGSDYATLCRQRTRGSAPVTELSTLNARQRHDTTGAH